MADTKHTGLISELAVELALIKQGYVLLQPKGDNSRYDYVLDLNNKFLKVQVKSARLINGTITANLYRTLKIHGEGTNNYHQVTYSKDEVDLFALYCVEVDKVYLLLYDEVVDQKTVSLRVENPSSNQIARIRYASDYEVTRNLG